MSERTDERLLSLYRLADGFMKYGNDADQMNGSNLLFLLDWLIAERKRRLELQCEKFHRETLATTCAWCIPLPSQIELEARAIRS